MKKLICKHCNKPALARVSPELFLTIGRISSSRISFLDKRCGHVTHMTSQEVGRQPLMTDAEIRHQSCDIPNSALEPDPKPEPDSSPSSSSSS